MAGSRTEKFGTIFSRITGLLKSGALKESDKPLWYDVYAAFPPLEEPKYNREIPDCKPITILYKEDAVRAKFYRTFGNPDIIDMKNHESLPLSQKFINKYADLEAKNSDQGDLFSETHKALLSEGIKLKQIEDIEKERKEAFRPKREAKKLQPKYEHSSHTALSKDSITDFSDVDNEDYFDETRQSSTKTRDPS